MNSRDNNVRHIRDAVPLTDQQLQDGDLPAWLEYQAMSAIAHLKRVKPDHWLVQAVYRARKVSDDAEGN